MKEKEKIVISASRRTDIPAFYMEWFMSRILEGCFEVQNPFSGLTTHVSAGVEEVHTIFFISKNFGPFLNKSYGRKLKELGYNLYFNFTLNSEDRFLEPGVPPLNERLIQIRRLAEQFGPDTISWRFDPICFYRNSQGKFGNNLGQFEKIAENIAGVKIKRCITSFMDPYKKIERRCRGLNGFEFLYPSLEEQLDIIIKIETTLQSLGIELFTCCEQELIDNLPPYSNIRPSSCVPNDLLKELFGGSLSVASDKGQRKMQGCGCKVSKDIGSYQQHPCRHGCLYCYANPKI